MAMRIRLGVVIWRVLLVLFVLFLLWVLVLSCGVSRMLDTGPRVSIRVVNETGLPVVITDSRSQYHVGAGQEIAVTVDASYPNDDCAEDVDVWTDGKKVFSREEVCEGETWVITAADLLAFAQVPVETYPPPEVQLPPQISMVISNMSSHDLEVIHADRMVPAGVGREITAYFESDPLDEGCVRDVAVAAADPEADFKGARTVEMVCDGETLLIDDDGIVIVSDLGDPEG